MRSCSCGSEAYPGRSKCRECLNKARRERYASDPAYRKKKQEAAQKSHNVERRKVLYHRQRKEAFDVLGGYICAHCGFDDPRALQIDHIENDGYQHRKQGAGNPAKMYRDILKGGGEGYQVLCANCNWIKKAEVEGRDLEYYGSLCDEPDPLDLSESYPHFTSNTSLTDVAALFGVSRSTLTRAWKAHFGVDTYRERCRRVQAHSATLVGLANKR